MRQRGCLTAVCGLLACGGIGIVGIGMAGKAEGFEQDAYRYAVKNAFLHNGKADLGAVVGKAKALHPKLQIGKAMPKIKEIIENVNSMPREELKKEYKKFEKAGFELKPAEKKPGLPELEWAAAGKGMEPVVTRFAPNPNGPFHLGNARAAILSHEYARMHKGKFILRFDDTDPKVKRPVANAEKLFKEDLDWLGCMVDETFFASDRLGVYYKFMKELVKKNGAYVCVCRPEGWKEKTVRGEACGCRGQGAKEQLAGFEKMLNGELKEGQAVLRVKTDLKHKDPSIRDWWAAKVVDMPEHPRVGGKQHVWPSYNFASAVDDHELGVTLIIRGQEHAQNSEKQMYLYKYFGWKYPHAIHFGRVKLEGMLLSTSRIKTCIESGEYTGWDDPRLGTIRALRRRGYDAHALRDSIIEIGVKGSDTTIELSKLNDLNKGYIDEESERVVFIEEPASVEVLMCPKTTVVRYAREHRLGEGTQKFIVEKLDIEGFKTGTVFRLRDAYNARVTRIDDLHVFAEFAGSTKMEKNIVPWVVDGVDVEIMMADAGKKQGICSEVVKHKKAGERLYLERVGYCRVDGLQDGRVLLWFTHK